MPPQDPNDDLLTDSLFKAADRFLVETGEMEQPPPEPMSGLEYAAKSALSVSGAFAQEAFIDLPLGIFNLSTMGLDRLGELTRPLLKGKDADALENPLDALGLPSPDVQLRFDLRKAVLGQDYEQRFAAFEEDTLLGSGRRVGETIGTVLGFVWGLPGKAATKMGSGAVGKWAREGVEAEVKRQTARATIAAETLRKGALKAGKLSAAEEAALVAAEKALKSGDVFNAWRNLARAKDTMAVNKVGLKLLEVAQRHGVPVVQAMQGFAAEAFLRGGVPGEAVQSGSLEQRFGAAFNAAMIAPLFVTVGQAANIFGMSRIKKGWNPQVAAATAGAMEGLGFSMFEFTQFVEGVKAAWDGDYEELAKWAEHAAGSALGFAFMKGVRPSQLHSARRARPEDFGPTKDYLDRVKDLPPDLQLRLWSVGVEPSAKMERTVRDPRERPKWAKESGQPEPKAELRAKVPRETQVEAQVLRGPRGSREQFTLAREGEDLVLIRGKRGHQQAIRGQQEVEQYLNDFASQQRQAAIRGLPLRQAGFEPAGIHTGVWVSPNGQYFVRFDHQGRLFEQRVSPPSEAKGNEDGGWHEVKRQGTGHSNTKLAIRRYGIDPTKASMPASGPRQRRVDAPKAEVQARARAALDEARRVWRGLREAFEELGIIKGEQAKELDVILDPFKLTSEHNPEATAELVAAMTSPEFLQTARMAVQTQDPQAVANLVEGLGGVAAGITNARRVVEAMGAFAEAGTEAVRKQVELQQQEQISEKQGTEEGRREADADLEARGKVEDRKAEAREPAEEVPEARQEGAVERERRRTAKEEEALRTAKELSVLLEQSVERVQRQVRDEPEPVTEYPADLKGFIGDIVQKVKIPKTGTELHIIDPQVMKAAEVVRKIVRTFRGDVRNDIEAWGREEVIDFVSEQDVRKFRLTRATREVRRKWGKHEEDMAFYLDKTGNPYVKGDTFEKLSARLPAEAKQWIDSNKIRDKLDGIFDYLVESGLTSDANARADLLIHLWTGNNILTRANELWSRLHKEGEKESRIPIFNEALRKEGFRPRVTKISDIMEFYESRLLTASAMRAMVERLKTTTLGEEVPMLVPVKKHPITHSAELKHPMLQGYALHKDLIKPMEKVFDWSVASDGFVNRLTRVNAIQKGVRLMGSFFHFGSLLESAFQIGDVRGVAAGIRSLLPGQKKYRERLLNDIGAEAVKYGLTVAAPGDVGKHIIDQYLEGQWNRHRDVPAPALAKLWGAAHKGAHKVKLAWDRALWENLHTTLKLWAWNKVVDRTVARNEKQIASGETTREQIKREAAAFVNDAFGGQNWGYYFRDMAIGPIPFGMRTRAMRARAQLALLAPDWTLSNLRVFGRTAGWVAEKLGTGTGVDWGFGAKTMRREAANYMVRSAILATVALQGAQWIWGNLMYSKEEKEALAKAGKTLALADNDPDIKMEPLFGVVPALGIRTGRDETGAWKYAMPLKQVSEVFRWLIDPTEIGGSKLSPLVQILSRQIFDASPGSNFPAPWEGMEFWDSLSMRMQDAVKESLPISLGSYINDGGSTQWMNTLPHRKGVSKFTATKFLTKFMSAYVSDRGMKDPKGREVAASELLDRIDNILDYAKANNVNFREAFQSALNGVSTLAYGELVAGLNEGDDAKAERGLHALSLLGTNPRNAATTLERRFVKLREKAEANFTEKEWRSRIIPSALRRLRVREGMPIRRYKQKLKREAAIRERDRRQAEELAR